MERDGARCKERERMSCVVMECFSDHLNLVLNGFGTESLLKELLIEAKCTLFLFWRLIKSTNAPSFSLSRSSSLLLLPFSSLHGRDNENESSSLSSFQCFRDPISEFSFLQIANSLVFTCIFFFFFACKEEREY